MFLGVSQHTHENESDYDESGYEVLHHGCTSTGLAYYEVGDRAAKDKATPGLRARRIGPG
jgi:hypothetical protein